MLDRAAIIYSRQIANFVLFYLLEFNWLNRKVRRSMADTDVMTVREVAEYLKVKERTIYRLVAKGGIPAFKVGGSWRFRRAEIDEWITRSTQDEKIKDSSRQRK